jgi:hypothetical protein
MIYVFAVAFESRVYFLFAEMQGISPADISIFHEKNIGVIAVVLFLEDTVVETRIDHEKYIVEVERVSDRMLI